MQEDPSLTREGKIFRGNIEDTEQYQGRHRVETLERPSERVRKIPMSLKSSTQTTSPSQKNTSIGSSQGGYVGTSQIPSSG